MGSARVTGDFNSDGKPDLAAHSSNISGERVSIFPGDGAGGFGPRIETVANLFPVLSGDFNGDGKRDLIAGAQNSFRVMSGDGAGNFSISEDYALGGESFLMTSADFNGDGQLDLVAANDRSTEISVIFGRTGGDFHAARNFPMTPTGTGSLTSVAAGDFNGDGKFDYAAVDPTRNQVKIFDGDGTGNFVAGTTYDGQITLPSFVTAADFNSDGKSDLAVASANTNLVLVLFGGLPVGSRKLITPGGSPGFIAIGDLNGDGKLDMAVANLSSIAVVLGDGAGNFGAVQTTPTGTNISNVAIGDFNNDSKSDLAVGNSSPSTVSILLGNGTGNFTSGDSVNVTPNTVTRRFVVAGDLNVDGKTDLAVTSQEGGKISIYFGDGTGHFGTPTDYPVGIFPGFAFSSDLNGDGLLDLGVLNSETVNVSILMGKGGGSFEKNPTFGVGAHPGNAAVADFNNDGKPDIVVANTTNANVTVLLSAPCSPPDVALSKSHLGDFAVGSQGSYRLKIVNVGLSRTTGATVLTDTLPVGLTFVSAEGVGWSCSPGQTVMCTHSGSLEAGEASVVTINALPTAGAMPNVVNNASVSNSSESNVANNSASDSTVVGLGATIAGHITDENGNSLTGATVFLTGALKQQTTTNSSGNYSFTGLPEGFTYTVSPSKTAFAFGPASRVFNTLRGNGTADFRGRTQTNGKIVFARNVGGNFDIFIMNADGTGVQQLTSGPEFDERPTWSPDGKRIAFQRTSGSFSDIFVMDADGSHLRNVTNGEGFAPAWSADGKKISFYKQAVAIDGIYTINADGSNQEKIVPHSDSNTPFTSTSWSPDNSRIAFSRQFPFSSSSGDIYLMDPDGRNQTVIIGDNSLGDSDAHFSPDGTKLVYISRPLSGPTNVVTANVDGSNRVALAVSTISAAPAWSPDGAKIVFRNDDDIFSMNADGSGLTNLTNTSATEEDPDWQPITTFPVAFPNPVDDPTFFVRQHYQDFLARDADAPGLNFWTNQITECGSNVPCKEVRTINVSGAFFLSIEFQETGYLVYRTYKAAYGNVAGTPVPLRLNEFFPDTERLGADVVVGAPGWQQNLERNKQSYFSSFIARTRFEVAYPTQLSPTQFVDALFSHAAISPTLDERNQAINEFGSQTDSSNRTARARALRRVADNGTFAQVARNPAFVLMQYFGYLRRNPDDAPNTDFSGYNFWLTKLNQFNGNFVNAEMVKAFLVSGEYRERFGR